jgi:hypothetical protein
MSAEDKIKLKENEQIVSVIRRYGFTFFPSWLLSFILIVTPFFFMFWLFNHGALGQGLFTALLLLGIFILARTLFVWQRNILIITTHRVVDIDQRGFFDKVTSNISYDQLEDVMGRIKGFWGTIFRYGNVTIQSGSGKVQVVVDKVKQPVYVQQEIAELHDKYINKDSDDFSTGGVKKIIDKLHDLEISELVRIRKAVKKNIKKLEEEQNEEEEEREEA